MKLRKTLTAFTLIELLVVITIISILAGIAVPVYTGAILNGKLVAAMSKARQVGLALRLYSNDNDGGYPQKKNDYGQEITTSNDAFRSLIPTYLSNESVFFVGGSKAGPRADNVVNPSTKILEPGENHWAYVSGLNSTSDPAWPLIVDHTSGSGDYTNREGAFGGTWKGTKAVVIHVDSSSTLEKLKGTGDRRFIPRFNDSSKNALEPDYMGEGVKLLEPAR